MALHWYWPQLSAGKSLFRYGALGCLAAGILACGGQVAPDADARAPAAAARPVSPAGPARDAPVPALPQLSLPPTPIPLPVPTVASYGQPTVGLLLNEPESFSGYTLFKGPVTAFPFPERNFYLIDNQGRVAYAWPQSGTDAILLENGNLLVGNRIGKEGQTTRRGMKEIAPDGTVVWEYRYPVHHDFLKLPNGNFLLLAREYKTRREAIAAGANPALLSGWRVAVDYLVEVKPTGPTTGDIVWEWHIWDHLIQDFDPDKPNYGVVAEHPELIDLNYAPGAIINDRRQGWTHANSLDYHPELDQIMISVRNFSEVWIIDRSTTTAEAAGHSGGKGGRGGDLLYRWGNPRAWQAGDYADQQLFWHHAAHWLDPGLPGAGNVLIFNNGGEFPGQERGYSSVIELTLPAEGYNYRREPGEPYGPAEPVWSYTAANPTDFYARVRSNAQRMPNGNTLINSGPRGIFFEVTPAGKTVWRYISPLIETGPVTQGYLMRQGENEVHRVLRYPPDYPGLQGLDLTPGEPVELYLGQ